MFSHSVFTRPSGTGFWDRYSEQRGRASKYSLSRTREKTDNDEWMVLRSYDSNLRT